MLRPQTGLYFSLIRDLVYLVLLQLVITYTKFLVGGVEVTIASSSLLSSTE